MPKVFHSILLEEVTDTNESFTLGFLSVIHGVEFNKHFWASGTPKSYHQTVHSLLGVINATTDNF